LDNTFPLVLVFDEIIKIRIFIVNSYDELGQVAIRVLSERYHDNFYANDKLKLSYIYSILKGLDGIAAYEYLRERRKYKGEGIEEYRPEHI
jgi:uncharacterized membrane protein